MMKLDQFMCNITKENFLLKNSMKIGGWNIIRGPF